MQSELPWSVEYVRARLGVQVTKYEVIKHLKRSAQDHWLAKRQLEPSAEQLAQILTSQDVMKLYEDFYYSQYRLTQGSMYSEKSSTPHSGSEANLYELGRGSFRSATPDLASQSDTQDSVDLGQRRFSASVILPPALAEHVAERTVMIHRSYSSPAVDLNAVRDREEPDHVPHTMRTYSIPADISAEPRSRNMLGRVRDGFMRMMGRRASDADEGPSPSSSPAQQRFHSPNAPEIDLEPSVPIRRQPSPRGSPNIRRKCSDDENNLQQQDATQNLGDTSGAEVDPPASSTVGPDFGPIEGLLGHTVYTKTSMGGYSQRGPRKTSNEDRFFAISDLSATTGQLSLLQPRIGFAGVFDGHGGSLAAEFCRTRLPVLASRSHHLDNLDEDLACILAETMRDVVDEVENELKSHCAQHNDTSGACAALVLFRGGRLCVANLGDCQVYMYDERGKVHCLSVIHRCSNLAELERLENAEVPIRDDRVLGVLEPTRSFGDFDVKSVNELSVIHTPYMLSAIVRTKKPMTTRPLLQQGPTVAAGGSCNSRRGESNWGGLRRRSLSFLSRPNLLSTVPKRSPPPSPRQDDSRGDQQADAPAPNPSPNHDVPHLNKTQSWYARSTKTDGGASGLSRLLNITQPGLRRNHSTSTLKEMGRKNKSGGSVNTTVNPFIVLATDGVWDCLKVPEVMMIVHDALQADETPEIAAQVLVESAVSNGSQDDATAVVILLK